MSGDTVTGRVYIDSAKLGRLDSQEGATLKHPGVSRNNVMVSHGSAGLRKKNVIGQLNFTLEDKKGLSIDAVNNIENENMTYVTDSGKTYALSGVSITEPTGVGGDGSVPVSCEVVAVAEVGAG